MNKYMKYTFAALSLAVVTTGCSDFGDTNVDPEHLNEGNVPYELIFTNAQHQGLGSDWDAWRNGLIYCGQWMQHVSSIDQWWSYSVYRWNDQYSSAYWNVYDSDRGAVRDITTVMEQWKDNPDYVLDYNMARVMRVFIMHRMTDLFGDIPYSQAGYPADYSYPKYDKQEVIYKDMLKELDEAQANLAAGGTAEMKTQDLYFQGDASKWQKFANSLMLRLAMRIADVDEATAKTYITKAVSGSLLASNADNVLLQHSDGNVADDSAEPYAKIFVNGESVAQFCLNETFVNALKGDPRLPLIGTVFDGANENPEAAITNTDGYVYGNSDPDKQAGLPCGYNSSKDSQWFIGKNKDEAYKRFRKSEWQGKESEYDQYLVKGYKKDYSFPNRYTYSDPTSPTFVLTYAQQELLLAEAAVRNYIDPATAVTHYDNGVRAALEQFSQFPNGKALYSQYMTSQAISNYMNKEGIKYDARNALKQINTQYWINCFCNEYEAFANWRRSGYPELQSAYDPANAYQQCATDGSIPRRFQYPTNETQINSNNYKEAVSGLDHGDSFMSRVWWDIEK